MMMMEEENRGHGKKNPSIWEVLVVGAHHTIGTGTAIPQQREGRWPPPNAQINWCEEDYQHSFYVAELFNTVTNLCYIIVGVSMLLDVYRKRASEVRNGMKGKEKPPIFEPPPTTHDLVCVCTILTGVFSGIFHATLQFQYQRLDEIFENGILIFMLHSKRPPIIGVLHFILASIGIVFITSYLFCEIHLITMIILTIVHYSKSCKGNREASTYISKSALYAVIGAICWLVDRVMCGFINSLLPFNPQLHSFWHIFTAIAIYYGYFAMATLQTFGVNLKKK